VEKDSNVSEPSKNTYHKGRTHQSITNSSANRRCLAPKPGRSKTPGRQGRACTPERGTLNTFHCMPIYARNKLMTGDKRHLWYQAATMPPCRNAMLNVGLWAAAGYRAEKSSHTSRALPPCCTCSQALAAAAAAAAAAAITNSIGTSVGSNQRTQARRTRPALAQAPGAEARSQQGGRQVPGAWCTGLFPPGPPTSAIERARCCVQVPSLCPPGNHGHGLVRGEHVVQVQLEQGGACLQGGGV